MIIMHNINYIRENPVEFDNFMKTRGENPIAKKIIDIDKELEKLKSFVLFKCLSSKSSIPGS